MIDTRFLSSKDTYVTLFCIPLAVYFLPSKGMYLPTLADSAFALCLLGLAEHGTCEASHGAYLFYSNLVLWALRLINQAAKEQFVAVPFDKPPLQNSLGFKWWVVDLSSVTSIRYMVEALESSLKGMKYSSGLLR